MMWTQEQAIELCRKINQFVSAYGCHIALTGGLLYKEGERKDCDILFYRIRQAPSIDMEGLFEALAAMGFTNIRGFGWLFKAEFDGKNIDMFFPEEEHAEDEYVYNADHFAVVEDERILK